MPRTPVPLVIEDLSTFARLLASQLETQKQLTHVQMLNLVARASGYKNYQHLLANDAAKTRIEGTRIPVITVNFEHVERALRCFNDQGVMVMWPAKRQTQEICLWPLWAALPPFGAIMDEPQVNRLLNQVHGFGDAALLRRELWGAGFVTRNLDSSNYQRVEVAPPPEARELIRQITGRRKLNRVFPVKAKG